MSPPSARLDLSSGLPDNQSALTVLSTIQSVRGAARTEYSRVYATLHPFYKDAVRAKVPSNAKIFRVYRHPDEQAKMLAQIIRFVRSHPSSIPRGRESAILDMVTAFEGAVFREFEQGLDVGDVEGRMKKYAQVLITLNGGQRAVDTFLSKNALFKQGPSFIDSIDWTKPSNTNVLESFSAYFSRLATAVDLQLSITERVFPSSLEVMSILLERLVKEIIRPSLRAVFDGAYRRTDETFLRIFSGTYHHCLQFASFLKPLDCSSGSLRAQLDCHFSNTYAPYFESYLKRELELFEQGSRDEVAGWEQQLSQQQASVDSMYMSSISRQAAKKDFLSSFKNIILAPVTAFPVFTRSASTKATGKGEPAEHVHTSSVASPPGPGSSASPGEPTTELAAKAEIMKSRLEHIKSLFSLEVTLNLVQMAKASLERTAVFADAPGQLQIRARQHCEKVFVVLVSTLGSQHVKTGFEKAIEHLLSYKPHEESMHDKSAGVAPLVTFLELVNVGDLIQQMLDVFCEQELVAAGLIDSGDFMSPAMKEKKRFEYMLDDRVAAGLNRGIEVLMAEVEHICSTTQKAENFNPGASGSTSFDPTSTEPTDTARKVVELVSAHTQMLVGSTEKNVLDVFNQEVGLRLFATLCKHLKRQRISVSGSIRLIRYALESRLSWS